MIGFYLMHKSPHECRRFAAYSVEHGPTDFDSNETKITVSIAQAKHIIVGLWDLLPPEERPGLKL